MNSNSISICLGLIFFINFTETQPNSNGFDATILSWIKSTGYGYNGILANINKIEYSSNYVYVHSEGIPSYSIGPWNTSEVAQAQNLNFKLSRNIYNLKEVTKNKTKATQKVGILVDGVGLYNSNDGQSYLNLGNHILVISCY
jgi:hypothetical protein